ncbi:metal ABC transporter solute-binding protein, Zn/Mn family [Bacillus alkalicellulosilyticus]|uniref:metal ABC transporter solute-binding protein, Zn/Mn family n=1 Tax=Alkalihalobacterium alkalicellulosilyticum TaxID=1912214 RepID=UPI000997B660|nr:zinc ABC transporter substrate-binding protein [Bacillus alkalicellulosilyticus]
MKWKAIAFSIMLALSSALAACGNEVVEEVQPEEEIEEQEDAVTVEPLKVFTTIYPLQDFTEKIGGEFVDVTNIIPVGADAHTFELTARGMIDIAEGDLFIYNGAGIEGFAEAVIDTVTNEGVHIVQAVEGIVLLAYDHDHGHEHDDHDHGHEHDDHDHGHEHDDHDHGHEHDDHDHGHEHDDHDHGNEHDDHDHGNEHDDHDHGDGHDEHHHAHGDEDPHVWLDPILSIEMAHNIKQALVELQPENAEVFEANFSSLQAELEALDQAFQELISEVEKDTFIVSHAGYGYWENRYGIKQVGITGISPTNEPSQKQLEGVIDLANELEINYVAFEQNISSTMAEVVASEIGADPVYIHNLEVLTNEDVNNNEDYFSLMRKNIEALQTLLQ